MTGSSARLYQLDPEDAGRMEQARALQEREGLSLFDLRVQAVLPRKWQLYAEQPRGMPETYPAPLLYLIDSPGDLASTARWQRFRDGMADMAAGRPDDPNFPEIVRAVDVLLAWRAALPPEDHFWKPD